MKENTREIFPNLTPSDITDMFEDLKIDQYIIIGLTHLDGDAVQVRYWSNILEKAVVDYLLKKAGEQAE